MTDAHGLVDHLFRERAGQMLAWLTRVFGPAHLDLAEEVVQDALVKALQQWPYAGVPANPAGWLFQVARNGAIDAVRRHRSFRHHATAIAAELTRSAEILALGSVAAGDLIQDDELRMIFLCCHPALPRDARVALSLKTAGGFSVQEIARAFLTNDAVIAQRLVRAKRRLRELDVPFELPGGVALAERIDSVLEVVYLLFNEGYAAREGDDLVRLDLCVEALRLARLVAGSAVTAAPAAHALLALIAFQSARLPSRVDDAGEIVLLEDQDRSLWDPRLIALGFTHLERSAHGRAMTPYHAQAAIAATHAGAASAHETRWDVILSLYDDLLALNPSPLVALNRVVAVWKVKGLDHALQDLATLENAPALAGYYLLPVVKGRLLAASGDGEAARRTLEAALTLPCSEPERRLLRRQIARLGN
ncbi:MAG TPA: sigma-70 family RNA polymerase sigma factor [Vicinamibacterales bacterium]|nr:sigma-70 family RNA polymerase sigma factor [Vicinamibacterales bacterium]